MRDLFIEILEDEFKPHMRYSSLFEHQFHSLMCDICYEDLIIKSDDNKYLVLGLAVVSHVDRHISICTEDGISIIKKYVNQHIKAHSRDIKHIKHYKKAKRKNLNGR